MSQIEFYKSFLFMLELLSAETLFFSRLKVKSLPVLRIGLSVVSCFLFSSLFPVIANNAFYVSFMFLTLFSFTVLMGKVVFDESWLKIVFCCVAGYTVQHLAYQFNSMLTLLITKDLNTGGGMYGDTLPFSTIFANPFMFIVYLFTFASIYALAYYFFGRRLRDAEFSVSASVIFSFVIILLVVDIVLNSFVSDVITDLEGRVFSSIYNIICCILGLVLQFEVLFRWNIDYMYRVQQIIHKTEKENYADIKEAMEIVNVRAHDLKRQVRYYLENNQISVEIAKEIEDSVQDYARYAVTGNTALDLLLPRVNLTCQKNNIRISTIVNGSLLSFMREEDVYCMFDNLFDNAIAALVKYPEEHRTMGLRVESVEDQMIVITMYNYCETDGILLKDGLPQTTKRDVSVHGFGLKSVARICDHYDGEFNVSVEDDFFTVNIVLPMPEDEEETENE